jgi:hypothetical protein
MSKSEIETARAALKAVQRTHSNHKENIRLMRAATAEAEAAVHACAKELADIAKAEATADRDRVQRLKAGGDAAAIGAERRAGVERQADLRDDLTGTQESLELLRAELASEEAKTEKLDDELAFAAEKVFTLQLDEVAAEINDQIWRIRDEWLEVRSIRDHIVVPEMRTMHGFPEPVRAARGLRYGRQTDIFGDSGIGTNGPFNQAEFSALGRKWSAYFQQLQSNADAPLPALGQPATEAA